MDSLKTATLPQPATVPVRPQVDAASLTGPVAPPADVFIPTQTTPVQIFLTPQQAMALCRPEAPAQPKSANDKLKEAVPGPMKMVVDGIPLPGIDAKIKPRFDNGGVKGGPTGVDFKLKW
ncbi:MAG: hypothetical protein KF760_02810 [Candidatus Eremiobacteraeota bacterium]|nr:hypothetical protein [Candidatus Eremiobacteraeota bacterium]MCW5870486.1 hypothetical protein [Candidatus Eremiobacteraeota bacterium]